MPDAVAADVSRILFLSNVIDRFHATPPHGANLLYETFLEERVVPGRGDLTVRVAKRDAFRDVDKQTYAPSGAALKQQRQVLERRRAVPDAFGAGRAGPAVALGVELLGVAAEQLTAEHGDNALYQKAQVLAQWGDGDAAFATLAEAKRLRDSGMVYLLNDPFLDPIRKDPRFNVLLSQAGFL